MCEPTTILAVMSAVSTFASVDAQKKSANYQAQVAANNARIADGQAKDALQRGNLAAQQTRRETDQRLGAQRAAMAARGLDIGEGSALSILEDTNYFGQVDQATVRANAEREAYGYRVQGMNFKAESNLKRAEASSKNPLLSAGMSFLGSGGGTVASKWFGSGASSTTVGTMARGHSSTVGMSV